MRTTAAVIALTAALLAASAQAEPTAVTVRVIARDAKFIGDETGGAKVVLKEARSGRVLAEGITRGGTGDTALVMQSAGRSPLRASPQAAAFQTTLDIAVPTLVDAEVEGPLGRPGSAVKAMAQRWILPGEPVTAGDGWTIELTGLAITPDVAAIDGALSIKVKVEPLCGCPITPGGRWDAADYAVEATLWRSGAKAAVAPLGFTTAPGGFAGAIRAPRPGAYTLGVAARNLKTGNSGYVELPVTAP